jgi:N-acetyl-anhydromuramyl-L-alanine amidase AmpD
VRVENEAFHTPGSLAGTSINRYSVGVEHAGFARQTPLEWADAYSEAMLRISAQLVASICKAHGIPPKHLSIDELKAGNVLGIAGHADCTKATGVGTHYDPGPAFPWQHYIEMVKEYRV